MEVGRKTAAQLPGAVPAVSVSYRLSASCMLPLQRAAAIADTTTRFDLLQCFKSVTPSIQILGLVNADA